MKEDGTSLPGNDREKAAVLANFFSSFFTVEPDGCPEPPAMLCSDRLLDININKEVVNGELKKLDITKSPGPDKIHPRILKEASHIIAKPLSLIFRESLDSGQLPDDWKSAHISAIYKKGRA